VTPKTSGNTWHAPSLITHISWSMLSVACKAKLSGTGGTGGGVLDVGRDVVCCLLRGGLPNGRAGKALTEDWSFRNRRPRAPGAPGRKNQLKTNQRPSEPYKSESRPSRPTSRPEDGRNPHRASEGSTAGPLGNDFDFDETPHLQLQRDP
jgi:hypothetical protein